MRTRSFGCGYSQPSISPFCNEIRLVAASEGLAGADEPTPQFLPTDYDDEAMREAMTETEWEENAEDE